MLSKGLAYAYLYQSHGTSTDRRDYGDMTLTFVREAKPVKLLKQLGAEEFKKKGVSVEKKSPGVYHVKNMAMFQVYLFVLGEMDFAEHPWLRALTRKLDKDQAKELALQEEMLKESDDRENVGAVLEASVRANLEVFEKAKGEMDVMGQAMMELMKPEIDQLMEEKDRQYGQLMEEKDRQYGQLMKEKMAEKDREIRELKKRLAKIQGSDVS